MVRDHERVTYLALFSAFLTGYLVANLAVAPAMAERLFGFSQLRLFGSLTIVLLIALGLGIGGVLAWYQGRPGDVEARDTSWARCAVLGVLAGLAFFVLRTQFINSDGAGFAEKFARDVPIRGAHVTHDEMWELYVHSRAWVHAHQLWGWSVEFTYQVISSMAGAVFVALLLIYAPRVSPRHPLIAAVCCISGGYLQLFFGDVENYTLTATLMLAYFLLSALYLERRISFLWPVLTLAIAITFHLESGFLLPSAAFMGGVEWRRGGRIALMAAGAVACGIVIATLWFFDRHGLPFTDLFGNSHAFAQGTLVSPSFQYYSDVAQLSFLLVPAWILALPLLVFRRIRFDAINQHLAIASASMTFFVLSWNSQLGLYEDWNLFAAAALPITLFVWRGVFLGSRDSRLPYPMLMAGLFLVHSMAWIVGNHLHR